MYVAVKGGEAAIRNAHRLLADRRRGDRFEVPDRFDPSRFFPSYLRNAMDDITRRIHEHDDDN